MNDSIESVSELPTGASTGQDRQAVAAIKGGETERFRELVERHERLVYAVAWSRLGDATLAEEVTQETFIRAYRRLWLLGDGAKFVGWISTIARRMAINFGLRHRRELNKRQRWAIEHSEPEPASASIDSLAPCTPELMRQTLAELPPAHRECLVLYYLEKRSGAEAAEALGISENTFRVRLHRARAALRERLENRLEHSLSSLRPNRTMIPAIMAAILSSSSAKAATSGVGTVVLGALGKLAPVQWLFALIPALLAMPMVLISWLNFRAELSNYRDPEGFRARMLRQQGRHGAVRLALMMAAILLGMQFLHVSQQRLNTMIGLGLFAILAFDVRKKLQINHSRHYLATTIATGVLGVGMLMTAFDVIPNSTINFFILTQVLILTAVHGLRPNRLDYSLFLRAAEGLLNRQTTTVDATNTTKVFQRRDLLRFGRFLGTRWLADHYRWTSSGLMLRLPRATTPGWQPFGCLKAWANRSTLHIGFDGAVAAHLDRQDELAIRVIGTDLAENAGQLEARVITAVRSAWGFFLNQSLTEAELAVGQVPESEVFVRSPTWAGSARLQFRVGLFVLAMWTIFLGTKSCHPQFLSGQQPVQANRSEVESFLNATPLEPNPDRAVFNSPSMALFDCLVLPHTNLFSIGALERMRDEVAGGPGFHALRENPDRAGSIFAAPLLRHAVAGGWISWADLNLRPEEAAAHLSKQGSMFRSKDGWDHLLTRREAWSWVQRERYPVKRIGSDGLAQLRLLKNLGRLDLLDTAQFNGEIASTQILSKRPAGQPEMDNWKSVRGLFFTPCYPALQDTYFALAALELCGGLDRIDRESCVAGILRLHQGEGYFESPTPGGYNEYHVDGSARDTFAAYESLRILGALERVRDLGTWQFRVASRHVSKPEASGTRPLTWHEVEAWVCKEWFSRMISRRASDPNAPFRSLIMEP